MRRRSLLSRSSAAHGFSFVELLFAVAVMGIGFIMLAAIFPVGLQQTKLTLDETTAAGNARAMSARLAEIARTQVEMGSGPTFVRSIFPQTFAGALTAAPAAAGLHYYGQVRTLNDPRPFTDSNPSMDKSNVLAANARRFNMWRSIGNELIQSGDSRLATTVLFKRDADSTTDSSGALVYTPAKSAQVFVINTQVANQPEYVSSDVSAVRPDGKTPATGLPLEPKQAIYNLEPRPLAVQIVADPNNGTYVATFFSVINLDAGAGSAIYKRGGYPPVDTSLAIAASYPGNSSVTVGRTTAGSNVTDSWDNILNAALGAPAEGAFVVISDDRVTAPATSVGRMNGRIFRLGAARPELTDLSASIPHVSFDLAPGYSFQTDPGADGLLDKAGSVSDDDIVAIGLGQGDKSPLCSADIGGAGITFSDKISNSSQTAITMAGSVGKHGAVALVLGRGVTVSSIKPNTSYTATASTDYSGVAQDVSIYTTFVPVPNP